MRGILISSFFDEMQKIASGEKIGPHTWTGPDPHTGKVS